MTVNVPAQPGLYEFVGRRYLHAVRRGYVEEHTIVKIEDVRVGRHSGLGVYLFGRNKPLPLTKFEGQFTQVELKGTIA